MGIFDDHVVGLPCPSCAEKTPMAIGELRLEPASYVCSGCGETVALDFNSDGSLSEALEVVDSSLENLKRAFRRLK